MKQFITKSKTNELIKNSFKDYNLVIEEIKSELEKIMDIEKRISGLKQHLRNTVTNTDFQAETTRIWNNFNSFNQFCKFKDLEVHKNEINPLVNFCKVTLEEYKKDNTETKSIISRFDEVLLEKASKFSVDNIEHQLKELSLK